MGKEGGILTRSPNLDDMQVETKQRKEEIKGEYPGFLSLCHSAFILFPTSELPTALSTAWNVLSHTLL